MARTKGSKNAASKSSGYNAQDAYVKQLEDELAILRAKAEAKSVEANDDEDRDEIVILQTDYIKVMSLLPYRLNLCTKEKGQGKIYRFDNLYQVKRIIYADLVDILEVNHSFLEAGFFIILNPKVVRAHGLDDIYEKILTKEQIEAIWDGTNESISLFTSATKTQQDVITEMVIQKLIDNPNGIDLNLVDKLSRLSGINLSQKAEDMRELLKPAA
jgi:hypothetical protein